MDRIPIPYVKGEEALAEDLCLVVRLDTQSLSRMERSETLLQFAQDIFVHGTTSSEIGSTFHGSTRPSQTLQSIFLSAYCLGARSPGRFSGLYPDGYWAGKDFCSRALAVR